MEPAGGSGLDFAGRAFSTKCSDYPAPAILSVPCHRRPGRGSDSGDNLHLRTKGQGLASRRALSRARIHSFPSQPVWGEPQPFHLHSHLYQLGGDSGHTPKATLSPVNFPVLNFSKWKSLSHVWLFATIIVNKKSPKGSTWMQCQKRQNDLCSFLRQTIQYHSNPSLHPYHYC